MRPKAMHPCLNGEKSRLGYGCRRNLFEFRARLTKVAASARNPETFL